ncbi:MAG TPA: transglutaminase family protein [Thermodesulfovibrionales bacterium]|nr:transglutaminase family protein [Thermodesulfovibrionales bacterium]
MHKYLECTDIIDFNHPAIKKKADELACGKSNIDVAKACFEWVRDEIKHIDDYGISDITCKASEVIIAGHGICYAKSHLLAALLRANSIPAGFCYQRLSRDDNGEPFCLHGLNAVYLPKIGWYRIDARGNKKGVNAQFNPPVEQVAFSISLKGEATLPEIWPDPLPVVISALQKYRSKEELWDNLPDIYIVLNNL